MKKIQKRKDLACVLTAALTALAVFGCQAQDPAAKEKGKSPADASKVPAGAVRKAMTPKGEILYIFAVWDAEAVPKDPAEKGCASAQCWQTKDGKTWCAKPLVRCPEKQKKCPGKNYMLTKDKILLCPEKDCRKSMMPCPKNWAVKEVKKCPLNGSAKCPAREHVKMKDGSRACAVKADAKAEKKCKEKGKLPVLADEIVEDDTFIVTAN